ncbi:TIGR02391 family protein [Streptomyces sp. NPDC015684]|uniref:TIGR02391 family protein n=1 Tax=Streptomyces sp. NPDC015684 TaxID=3364963 RepID=UPI003702552E
MDRDWMLQRLGEFNELTIKYRAIPDYEKENALLAEMNNAEPTVIRILQCLDPELAKQFSITRHGMLGAQTIIRRAMGICEDMGEWATRLAPDAPSLAADQFHPWVWDAARTFWESGHYRVAVHEAATSINAHLQNKLSRRDVSDAKLVAEALSENPPSPGKPRLRIPGDHTDLGVQTRQRGALQLGQGAYSALRNPAAHESSELTEQEALEQLATFSVVARLLDMCQVVR